MLMSVLLEKMLEKAFVFNNIKEVLCDSGSLISELKISNAVPLISHFKTAFIWLVLFSIKKTTSEESKTGIISLSSKQKRIRGCN